MEIVSLYHVHAKDWLIAENETGWVCCWWKHSCRLFLKLSLSFRLRGLLLLEIKTILRFVSKFLKGSLALTSKNRQDPSSKNFYLRSSKCENWIIFCSVVFSGLVSLLSIHLITFYRQRLWNVSQWITYAIEVNIRCSMGTTCDYYEYRNLECIMYVLLTVV